TIGTLCGRKLVVGQPLRLPSTMASASAADPALMCTAVPPAKSSACHLAAMMPPPQIQCAPGTYTRVNQPAANTTQPPNLARSEMGLLMSATVMIANIIWNASTTYVGIPMPLGFLSVASHRSDMKVLPPRYCVKLPIQSFVDAFGLVPNDQLNPYMSQR